MYGSKNGKDILGCSREHACYVFICTHESNDPYNGKAKMEDDTCKVTGYDCVLVIAVFEGQ